ncbi:MAG: hypothetical protein K6B65_04585 [Bacilli bacterium]|nr:hypothetical protein [Bacilli bacterium]
MAKTGYVLPMVGSYDGDEPFVYASYCKSDANQVANILAIGKREHARISFEPSRIYSAITVIIFLSKAALWDRRVLHDMKVAKELYMDTTCFYLDGSYLGKEKEKEYGFRFVHLNEVSILQYGSYLTSRFPADVFPGPPKKVSTGN